MTPPLCKSVATAAVLGALLLARPIGAAEAPSRGRPAEPPDTVTDQFVVTARALGELRLRIRRAEDAVFARFNEINSDDRFDIHCYSRATTGSRIERRVCLSNSYREQDRNIGQAALARMRGEYGPDPSLYRETQILMERRLADEMQRLSAEDPALHDAMVRLGQAQQALELVARSGVESTRYRVRSADGLPAGARRVVDVQIGSTPWTYPVKRRAFTLLVDSGEVQTLRVACDHGGAAFAFQPNVQWSLPESWGACTVSVSAKPDTAFSLVELD